MEKQCGITNGKVERKHAELCKSAWRFRQEALVIWKKKDLRVFNSKKNHLILRALGVDSSH